MKPRAQRDQLGCRSGRVGSAHVLSGLLGLLCVSIGASGAVAARPKPAAKAVARTYDLPGHGRLQLSVPAQWPQTMKQVQPSGTPGGIQLQAIEFKPQGGANFAVGVGVFWDTKPGYNSPQALRSRVEASGKAMLRQAVEKSLVIRELKGPQAVGYYFAPLTDKTLVGKPPVPDNFKYLSHGWVAVGDVTLGFFIGFQKKDAPEYQAALAMIRSAKWLKAKG